MRIVLVGAPDIGKRPLANRIGELVPDHDVQLPTGYTSPNIAVGVMADYRMEIHLAIERMWESRLRKSTIYTNSLIDSLTYAAYRYFVTSNYEVYSAGTQQKWEWTTNLIGSIMEDSFTYDYIFRYPGHSDDTGEEISAVLDTVLDEYNLPYLELSGNLEQDAEEVKRLVGS